MKDKTLNLILILSFIILIFSLIIFVYFFYFKNNPDIPLKISLTGPDEVLSLENYEYKLIIENNSKNNLKNVNAKIFLSNGAFLSSNIQEKEISIFLGDLESQRKYEYPIYLFFINNGGLKESIRITLTYKLEGKNYSFSKEQDFSVLVKNAPLKFQIYLPNKIYVNQPFQANFQLVNLSNKTLNNIQVSIETPEGFLLTSVFPESEKLYWEIPSLSPKDKKIFTIIGQVQDPNSSGVFSAKTNFSFSQFNFLLPKEVAKSQVLNNPISLSIKSSPADSNVLIGSSLFYEVNIENKTQTTLEDNEIKVTFNQIFDKSSLNTDGYFSQSDEAVYWNSRNKPELLSLKPGDKVKINFSINLFKSYPILGKDSKNFKSKARVEFKTKSIPEEIESETRKNEYVVFQEDEKKIIGDLDLSHNLVYDESSTGPFPLEANKLTTLTWNIKIKSLGEDFKNLTLNTKFPIGVNFLGIVENDAILDNVKFDNKTGNFLYSLSNIPANSGYSEKEIVLSFKISVEPQANIDILSLVIIPQVNYSAIGEFTQTRINKSLREINSREIIKK